MKQRLKQILTKKKVQFAELGWLKAMHLLSIRIGIEPKTKLCTCYTALKLTPTLM